MRINCANCVVVHGQLPHMAYEGRWYGRKDQFQLEFKLDHKRHAGGNATFVKSVSRSKRRAILAYDSLSTSAPMTRMTRWNMIRAYQETSPNELIRDI